MRFPVVLTALWLLTTPLRAGAQPTFESVGERALGMAGAFVAVADDSTAVHWNPAGLVHGGPAGMTIGWDRFQFGNSDAPMTIGSRRRGTAFTSLGSWPVGVSFGRFNNTAIASDENGVPQTVRLRVNQYGLTMLQTLIEGIVVGGTVKYLRGNVASAPSQGFSNEDAFESLDDIDGITSQEFDVDLGLMVDMDKVRVGFVFKNLLTPEFTEVPVPATTLQKQMRMGVAVLPTAGLTLAMDIDLDTVDLHGGDLRRNIAFGGESRLGGRMAVRGGVRWSLEGLKRTVWAGGASVLLRPGMWIDSHYSYGTRGEDRGFGASMRAGF